jgi:hypothetical protein
MWWFSMPAILKGWVERVYAHGFAYGVGEHSDKRWGDRYGEGMMGGPGAPDDLAAGAITQTWLAVSDEPDANTTGGYFYHQKPASVLGAARDAALQDELLTLCAELSGVALPDRARLSS